MERSTCLQPYEKTANHVFYRFRELLRYASNHICRVKTPTPMLVCFRLVFSVYSLNQRFVAASANGPSDLFEIANFTRRHAL